MIIDFKRALVLSGGSIKGAFEAGAVKAILDRGYTPGYLIGISVGSLNCAYLSNAIGKQKGNINWQRAANELWDFWANEITCPKKLVKQKSNFGLLLYFNWSLLFKQYRSILDTTPLRTLITKTIERKYLMESPLQVYVGTVNIYTGEIKYSNSRDLDFLSYLIASTAIPLTMPIENINGQPYLDGGIRDVAPLGKAMNMEANEIVGVCCQAEKMEPVNFNCKNFVKLSSRIMDITVNEVVNNDIKQIELINKIIETTPNMSPENPISKYRNVPMTIIRPENELKVEIENFNQQDILNLLNEGYEHANKMLGDKYWEH